MQELIETGLYYAGFWRIIKAPPCKNLLKPAFTMQDFGSRRSAVDWTVPVGCVQIWNLISILDQHIPMYMQIHM